MILEQKFEYFVEKRLVSGDFLCIRPIQIADRVVLQKNIQSVCDENIYLMTNEFIITEEWQRILENAVDEQNRRLLLVSEINGKAVGHLRLFPEWFGPKGSHVGQIGMALIKEFRNQGIGSELLNYAINWAKFVGLKKLTASIFASNERALNLFEKFSFIQEGRKVKQFFVDGGYIDEILYARFLN